MKNDIVLLEHLKVLQQKLSSTEVPNRKKIITESLQITDISNQSNFKFRKMKNNKYFILAILNVFLLIIGLFLHSGIR